MRAGTLRNRITIEANVLVDDPDYGPQPGTWQPIASRIPAEVQDVLPSKSERVTQGIRVATQPARIRIRYRAGITSDMRVIVHGPTDRTMQIVGGPAVLGRREGLEMVCEEYSI
jgi:head-tail adaptor